MRDRSLRNPEIAPSVDHIGNPMLASAIVQRALPTLKPFSANPREHSEKQLAQLVRNIRAVGFTNPILIDETGTILSGHGRWEAARRLGMPSVPTLTYAGCSEAQKRAIVLAENRLAEMSTWNSEHLKKHLEAIIELDFDVELTGFSTAQIDIILDGETGAPSIDPQDVLPKMAAQSVSEAGDLWLLGRHKLLCGDARDRAAYKRLLGKTPAQMVLTDAPYNVKIQGHARSRSKTQFNEFAMASGEMTNQEFRDFLLDVMACVVPASVDGSVHYWFMDWRHLPDLIEAGRTFYDAWKQLLVWNKVNAGQGSFYRSQHELIAVFRRGAEANINNFGLGASGRYRTNVIDYPGMTVPTSRNRRERELHPTVKPVGLLADLIKDCSNCGGIVFDPFAGSGSTILAAERTGRLARAIEIEPLYVDIAINRWQQATKCKAIHQGTNKNFEELQQTRLGDAGRRLSKPEGGNDGKI